MYSVWLVVDLQHGRSLSCRSNRLLVPYVDCCLTQPIIKTNYRKNVGNTYTKQMLIYSCTNNLPSSEISSPFFLYVERKPL